MNLIEYEKKIIVTLEFKKYTMLSQESCLAKVGTRWW